MAYMNTPRAYAAAVQKYAPGTEKRKVAEMRAVLAAEAARAAHEDGDYARASRALEGLHRLGRFGDVDPRAIAEGITRDLTSAAGRLSPDERAIATGRNVADTIQLVQGIAGPIMDLITTQVNDPGLTRAWNWVQVVLTGRTPPTFTEGDLREMAGACRVWNGGVKVGVTGVMTGIRIAVAAARTAMNDSDKAAADTAMRVINSFVTWVVSAMDGICSSLGSAFPGIDGSCVGVGRAGVPRRVSGAAECCAGFVRTPQGYCVPEREAPTPAQQARARFERAFVARRNVEAALWAAQNPTITPRPTAAAIAAAQANDARTAAELCAAGQALLTFQNPLPAMPRSGAAAALDTRNWLTVAATLGAEPSSAAYCNLGIAPAGGCPSGCELRTSRIIGGGGGGGAQGGGGAVAVALPAVALLWYLMR